MPTFHIFMNVLIRNNTIKSISKILPVIILVTLPLGGYAINSISIIIFFLFGIYNSIIKKEKIEFNSLSVLFISFYIICILSLLWTDSIQNTINGLTRFLSFFIIPLSFSLTRSTSFNVNKILDLFSKTLVLYAIYCCVIGIYNAIIFSDKSYLYYHKLSGNLNNLNAIYLSVFVSLGITNIYFKKNKTRLEKFSFLFLMFFLILLSSKSLITLTITFLSLHYIGKLKYQGINFRYIFIIIGCVFIFLVASKNLSERVKIEIDKTEIHEILNNKDFGPVYLWTGVGLRVFQIKAFGEILKEHKRYLLGLGLNNSQESLVNKYKEYNLYHGFYTYNFHNQYIQTFAELGIVGLVIMLFIFFLIFKKSISQKDTLLLFFIVLILIVSFTESFIWRQRGMVFFITISLLLFNKNNTVNKS